MSRHVAVYTVAFVLLVVLALSTGRANATTATIEGQAICLEDGRWQVSYQIYNDDPRPLVIDEQDPAIWPESVPGKSLVFSDAVFLETSEIGHSASVIGTWAAGEPPAFLVGIVDLRELTCDKPTSTTTTSTPTTVPPESSTTTTTVQTSSTSITAPDSTVTSTSAPISTVGPAPLTSQDGGSDVAVPSAVSAGGGELPETGLPDWAIPAIVVGLALFVLGVLALVSERR